MIEKEYLLIDPPELPGFLFFDKKIINKYTMCPFIKLNETTTRESILANRKDWLNNTIDNGKIYYDLYNTIIKKTEIIQLKESYLNTQIICNNIIDNIFNELQKKLYKESLEYLTQYTNATIKTKKIKELFKILINNISILVIETQLNIHLYLSLIYKCDIPINNLNSNINENINIFLCESFNEKVTEYKEIIESITLKERFIINTTKNLQLELYEYLNNNPIQIINQIGKYNNKKWSELTVDEKNDRFESFSKYFVQTYLISTNLLDISQKNDTIENLYNILLQSHMSIKKIKKIKILQQEQEEQQEQQEQEEQEQELIKLKSKDIRWNIKSGIITKIASLQWDDKYKKLFIQSEVLHGQEDTDVKVNQKRLVQ